MLIVDAALDCGDAGGGGVDPAPDVVNGRPVEAEDPEDRRPRGPQLALSLAALAPPLAPKLATHRPASASCILHTGTDESAGDPGESESVHGDPESAGDPGESEGVHGESGESESVHARTWTGTSESLVEKA